MAEEDVPLWEVIQNWLRDHMIDLIVAAVIIFICVIFLALLRRQITRLVKKDKLTEKIGKTINRASRWIVLSVLVVSILLIFNVTVGAVTGIIALFGGTIIGFAAINTIGNAIAGIIVMTSKPFQIGDRILYKEIIADVFEIELMYTKLRALDNAIIFVPNQEMLNKQIKNFGMSDSIRQSISISVDYGRSPEEIKELLLLAASVIEDIPTETLSVSVKALQNYAVEYAMFYDVTNVKKMYAIESNLKLNVLKLAAKQKIDLRTPILSQNIGSIKVN